MISARYQLIDISNGNIGWKFDDGQEKEMVQHILKMLEEGCCMEKWFVMDLNGMFKPIPVMIYARS